VHALSAGITFAPKALPDATLTVIVRVAVLLGPGGSPLSTTSCTVYTPLRRTVRVGDTVVVLESDGA
jgi:hypothetical protein